RPGVHPRVRLRVRRHAHPRDRRRRHVARQTPRAQIRYRGRRLRRRHFENSMSRKVRLKIRRQEGPGEPSHWEEFDVPWLPRMNVITALMEVRKNPVTVDGKNVAPVAWES